MGPKNGKIESLTHAVMSLGKMKEWQVALAFVLIEALFVGLAFVLA